MSDALAQWQHYINGQNAAPVSGRYSQSFDPCTGLAAAEIASGNEADVERAVNSDRKSVV